MNGGRGLWGMRARGTVMLTALLLIGQSLAAQTSAPAKPAPSPAAASPAIAPPAAGDKPAQPQQPPYSYGPDGRRDPFVSLIARGTQPTEVKGVSTGVSSLTTGEISVRGVVQARGSYVAMIQGPDAKTYIVHVNDHLVDGVIKQITPQGLIVLQEVSDPLSPVKQREIRKNLRSAEEGK